MPDSMSDADRRRLSMILARLASPHDGEALNAARLAVAQMAKHGHRPEELGLGPVSGDSRLLQQLRTENIILRAQLEGLKQAQASRPFGMAPQPEPGPPAIRDAAKFAEELIESAVGMTAWEQAFCNDLAMKGWSKATPKQAAILWRIHNEKMPPELRRSA